MNGFDGAPDEMETFEIRMVESRVDREAQNLDAYLDQMMRYLKMDGVLFPNNKPMKFHRLDRDGRQRYPRGRPLGEWRCRTRTRKAERMSASSSARSMAHYRDAG